MGGLVNAAFEDWLLAVGYYYVRDFLGARTLSARLDGLPGLARRAARRGAAATPRVAASSTIQCAAVGYSGTGTYKMSRTVEPPQRPRRYGVP